MTIKHHTKVTKVEWPSEFFTPAEIACRHSGMVMLTPDSLAALRKLDALRRAMGHPLNCTSGYRSPEHNAAVGGAKNSFHMKGVAFDISMANVDPHQFEAAARAAGFTGIGIYPPQKPTGARNFIHVDTRPGSWRGAQWGEFPRRASRFSAEPPPTPVKDALREAGPVLASGGAIEAAIATAEPALRETAPWLPANLQGYAIMAAVAIGLGLALWRIFNSRQRGE